MPPALSLDLALLMAHQFLLVLSSLFLLAAGISLGFFLAARASATRLPPTTSLPALSAWQETFSLLRNLAPADRDAACTPVTTTTKGATPHHR